MSIGFQRYREGDREGAAEAFLAATFAPKVRQRLDQISPGGWTQNVRDADTFFGVEVPELQHFQFGEDEAERITALV
jgi:3-oxoadipate enol-lactonase